jgi:hypothetical protein
MYTPTQITDEQLKAKLMESLLDQKHKNTLLPLIPKMNDKERFELFALIEESFAVEEQTKQLQDNYKKERFALNKEYEKNVNTVVAEETKNARKQFESLEKDDSQKTLEELEEELKNI